ncbi:hypothetical protein BXZ70DRAFT_932395 [Cristinia sonorae]|uniref:mRNA 3'-end-processing protein RNA14 n=1 Tax=Cristinia sonorae TaxID=1940300 RepID=A0A8K0URM7_9AGAR|nr:hypothetical protein BXZ70DRAFT_932395 [Cristinia sonorae]
MLMENPTPHSQDAAAHDDSGFIEDNDKTQPVDEHANALRDLMLESQASDFLEPGPSNQSASTRPNKPQSRLAALRARVQEKPNQPDAWLELIAILKVLEDYDKIVETYEAMLKAFPNTPSIQLEYLTYVSESSEPSKFQTIATLFNRFLKVSPFVELWKYYLSHVRKLNSERNARDTVRKAYEFALNYVGHDQESGEIWRDYIQFLKGGEAPTTFDESQKMDAIRKAYQRAIVAPTALVEQLWNDYSEFENALNAQLAKKFLSDYQAAHAQARTAFLTLQNYTAALFPSSSSDDRQTPSLPRHPTFSSDDKVLMARWRQYLKWEESNSLGYDEKDKCKLHTRVQAAYRKAVVQMRFFPEFWYMAFFWTTSISSDATLSEGKRKEKKEEAMSYLRSGIEANPESFVLNFAYAEALEEAKENAEVHECFRKFIAVLHTQLEEMDNSQSSAANSQMNEASFNSQSSEPAKTTASKELSDRRTEYGVAWIAYIRFARRAESQRAARDVFAKARKDKWTPWEVYEAAALMEYHCTKASDVAMRIFERGVEKFPHEEELALRYLGFLISVNDDTNARAFFERIVPTFPPERARGLWDRWTRYEYQYGSLQSARDLEKRMAGMYPNEPPIKRFADRHKYLNVDAIAVRDLGFKFGRTGVASAQSGTVAAGSSSSSQAQSSQDVANSSQESAMSVVSSGSSKRPATSSQHGRDVGPPPAKKHRVRSPSVSEASGSGRHREGGSGRRDGSRGRDEPAEQVVNCPPVISWFMSVLPEASSYEGPVFKAEDMMHLLRNTVIPSSTGIGAPKPAPPLLPSSSLPLSSSPVPPYAGIAGRSSSPHTAHRSRSASGPGPSGSGQSQGHGHGHGHHPGSHGYGRGYVGRPPPAAPRRGRY